MVNMVEHETAEGTDVIFIGLIYQKNTTATTTRKKTAHSRLRTCVGHVRLSVCELCEEVTCNNDSNPSVKKKKKNLNHDCSCSSYTEGCRQSEEVLQCVEVQVH